MLFTQDEFAKYSITPGDLLVCEGGDVGRAAIWRKDIPMCIQNHIHRLRAYYPVCTAFYYFAFYAYKSIGLIGGKGIGIQGLSSGALGKLFASSVGRTRAHCKTSGNNIGEFKRRGLILVF